VEGEDPTYNLRTYWGLERVATVESYTQREPGFKVRLSPFHMEVHYSDFSDKVPHSSKQNEPEGV